ncbi:hypothetical protein [Herbidospora cretacea]|uniref:hypothetical protein n=1 Tax=Herbidospora cretacea TaxID=28444 RepID=UPI0004C2E3C7|nr:hypothetical protein [Herbidospora cretacea]
MRLIAGLSDVVPLDSIYGVTGLGAFDLPGEPGVWEIEWKQDDGPSWLTPGRNGLRMTQYGPGPFHLRYELWDADPGDPAERSWTGRVHFASGRLAAYTLDEENETYEEFDLGRAGAEWNVRVDWWSLREALRPEFAVHEVRGQVLRFRFWP